MADLLRRRRVTAVDDQSVLDTVTIERDISFGAASRATADVFLPSNPKPAPVVVVAHGLCGIRADMTQVAIALAQAGVVVVNAGWRNVRSGHRIDDSLTDLAHAVSFAHARWRAPATLVAWSDGALPAAVVALDPRTPDERPGAFVGLNGHYGWPTDPGPSDAVDERTLAYFGGPPGSIGWRTANPHRHVAAGSAPPITLIAGDESAQLPQAREFHEALAERGHRVRIEVISGCDHFGPVIPRLPPGRETIRHIVDAAHAVEA